MNTQIAGILYPGEIGFFMAKALRDKGWHFISVADGRSQTTLRNMRDAGIDDVDSLQHVALRADLIISAVTPQNSVDVARQLSEVSLPIVKKPVFWDVNSNTPAQANEINALLSGKRIPFVNGAVLGPAVDIPRAAPFLLSGNQRHLVHDQLSEIFEFIDCGENIGAASAFKLLFAEFNKGINAVLFEAMLAAHHFGIADSLLGSLRKFVPQTFVELEKTTPTYPKHIDRRVGEMAGLVDMLKAENLPSRMASATATTFSELAQKKVFTDDEPHTVQSVLAQLRKLTQ